jgi:hypothetical protein
VEFAFHLAGRLRSGVGLVNAEQAQVVFACRRSFRFPIAPDFILHSAFLILHSPHGTGSSSKIFWMTVSLVFFPGPGFVGDGFLIPHPKVVTQSSHGCHGIEIV